MNNNEACNYDESDCCGLSMKKNFCVDCICKGMSTIFQTIERNWFNYYFLLVFRCKVDADCSGNGYCHVGICICSPNYEYALDCSHYGCKYIIS